ncbi:hypothetical protein KY317_03275 [Candidatus Woesearchaeota archaeon]|nr:hypothetical protein [Candidatus Woesearchaeota archaeon]
MATTIQISEKLQKELFQRKMFDRESYEEIIWDLIEDTKELSEETKRNIVKSREDIKKGRVKTLKQIEKEIGL